MTVEVSTDPGRVDIGRLHEWLTGSYWANERTMEDQLTAVANSMNFSAFIDGEMVGYARMVTDGATFGWLCDVIVAPEYRGKGIGTAMMDAVFSNEDVLKIRRFLLGTRDAHALYRRYDFVDTEQGRIMRRGFKNLVRNE